MSDEFKHASVGTELTQAEWEAAATHVADGQAAGDILYFDGSYWKRRKYDIGAHVYHNANQSVPNYAGSWTTVQFNSEKYDTDNMHDTVTNNERLTAKTAGKYLLIFSCTFASNATGLRYCRIYSGGTIQIGNAIQGLSGDTTKINAFAEAILDVNDYAYVEVAQTSGIALDILYEPVNSPIFIMRRVG